MKHFHLAKPMQYSLKLYGRVQNTQCMNQPELCCFRPLPTLKIPLGTQKLLPQGLFSSECMLHVAILLVFATLNHRKTGQAQSSGSVTLEPFSFVVL